MLPDDVLKVDEAAAIIGCARPTVYRLAREYPRELKNYKLGRYRVFDKAAVERFARARRELTQL